MLRFQKKVLVRIGKRLGDQSGKVSSFETKYLGHIINKDGVRIGHSKVEALNILRI